MRLLKSTLLLFIMIVGLTACTEKRVVIDEIHHHLNEAVIIEADFEKHQERLNELEQEESNLYNRIIEMTDAKKDDRQKTIDEAKDVLGEKKEELKLIQKMLKESKLEFEQIKPLIEEIQDHEHVKQLHKMYDAMTDRYEAYDSVFDSYIVSIELTNELYDQTLLDDDESSKIFTTIKNVNESYDEIMKKNEQFNDSTVTYNALKTEFYDLVETREE